jgi:hypothetical protein
MRDLLEQVAAIDNRKVTPERVKTRHDVCGKITFTVAERALVLARRDATVQYMEPRHVMAKVAVAAAELNDEERKKDPSADKRGWKREPIPVCKAHDLAITKCQECVTYMNRETKNMYGTQQHDWAVRNLYREDSVV